MHHFHNKYFNEYHSQSPQTRISLLPGCYYTRCPSNPLCGIEVTLFDANDANSSIDWISQWRIEMLFSTHIGQIVKIYYGTTVQITCEEIKKELSGLLCHQNCVHLLEGALQRQRQRDTQCYPLGTLLGCLLEQNNQYKPHFTAKKQALKIVKYYKSLCYL